MTARAIAVSGTTVSGVTGRATRGHPMKEWSSLFASPVLVGSIAVLLVNDHVLKSAWPGLVTGKLSDVAGVLMLGVLATVVLRRPCAACVAVAVAFGLLKTVPAVADLAVPVLGGRTLTDATDLLAVVALIPLWRWMSTGPKPCGSHRVVLKSAAVCAAVLATSATSCAESGVQVVGVVGGVIYVEGGGLDSFQSEDGGRTWTRAELDRTDVPYSGSKSVCDQDGVCFELVGRGVERIETNGERSTDFEVSEDEYDNLVGNLGSSCSYDGGLFSSIGTVDAPDGSNVVVTMSEYGVLHRSADGVWTWVDVGELEVGDAATRDPLEGRISNSGFSVVSVVVTTVVLLAGITAAVASSRRRHSGWWIGINLVIGVLGAISLVVLSVIIRVFSLSGVGRGLPYGAPIALVAVGLVLVAMLVLIQRFAKPPPPRLY
jgi:hypothetical protein